MRGWKTTISIQHSGKSIFNVCVIKTIILHWTTNCRLLCLVKTEVFLQRKWAIPSHLHVCHYINVYNMNFISFIENMQKYTAQYSIFRHFLTYCSKTCLTLRKAAYYLFCEILPSLATFHSVYKLLVTHSFFYTLSMAEVKKSFLV